MRGRNYLVLGTETNNEFDGDDSTSSTWKATKKFKNLKLWNQEVPKLYGYTLVSEKSSLWTVNNKGIYRTTSRSKIEEGNDVGQAEISNFMEDKVWTVIRTKF